MIRQRRCDDHGGRVDHALGQILGEGQIVAQLEVRPVLLAAGAERDEHDRLGREDRLGLLPRQRFEAVTLGGRGRRLGQRLSVTGGESDGECQDTNKRDDLQAHDGSSLAEWCRRLYTRVPEAPGTIVLAPKHQAPWPKAP